jgi:hypothetical protein
MALLSHAVIHETISQNGKVIKNLDADTVSSGDSNHSNFITKGEINGKPFVITNVKGILKKQRRTNKKRKSVRFRTPTPYPGKNRRKTRSHAK